MYRINLSALCVLLLSFGIAQECVQFEHGSLNIPCGETLTISASIAENSHAMRLNGISSYLHCTANEAFNLVDKNFSLSAWIRPDDAIGRQNIISSASSTWASHGAYTLYIQDGLLRFTIRHMESSPWYRHLIGPEVPIDQWTHVAAVGNRDSQEMSLYMNGDLVSTQAWDGEMFRNTSLPLLVGVQYKEDWPGQYFAHFNGDLDDIGIWESALSETEISTLFACPEQRPSSDSIVAFWDMHEGEGQMTEDISPNKYELIRLNSAAWVNVTPYGQAPFTTLWSTGESTAEIAPQVVSDSVFSVSITDSQGFQRFGSIEAHPTAPESELIDVEVCFGDSYTFPDGLTIPAVTQAISYEYHPPHDACGAPAIFMVTPREMITTVTNTGDALRADAIARSYSWVKCVGEHSFPILGASERSYIPSGPAAQYSVMVNDGRCDAMSDCVEWIPPKAGTKRLDVAQSSFYPNPSVGLLRWTSPLGQTLLRDVQVYDGLGRLTQRFEHLNPQSEIFLEQPGFYIIRWIDENGKTSHQKIRITE